MATPPYLWEENFESSVTIATATSGSLIDVPHFTELARQGMAPYRGAYCLRIRLAGGTTSQFIREDTAFDDLIASTTRYIRLYFYLGKDLVMADGDKFSLFEAESTLNTVTEAAFGIIRTGAQLLLWYNETTAAATPTTIILGNAALGANTALGQWNCFEMKMVLDAGGGNDGTLTGYFNDGAAAAITALDQAAIVDAKIGVIGPDAGTSGTVLIDKIYYDDLQIFKDPSRFRNANAYMTSATDHIFLGPGRFSCALTGTGTNAVLTLYDSDGIPTNLAANVLDRLRNLTANERVPSYDALEVTKGLYATLSGTNAEAFFSFDECGPAGLTSEAQIINLGIRNGAPRR
jgi:hypothetical protein